MKTGESIDQVLGKTAEALVGRPGALLQAVQIAVAGRTELEVVAGLRVGMSLADTLGNKPEVVHGADKPLAAAVNKALKADASTRPRSKPPAGPK